MLKICDNVGLKELEKFGFSRVYVLDCWGYTKRLRKGEHYEEYINVWEKDRDIQCSAIELLDTLYDLFQAGLVEKVGDE